MFSLIVGVSTFASRQDGVQSFIAPRVFPQEFAAKERDSNSLDFLRRQKQPRIARGHQCAPTGERLEKELVCDERGLVSERGVAGASTRTATLTTMIRGMMQVNSEPTER